MNHSVEEGLDNASALATLSVLSCGELQMKIDHRAGGRVVSLSLGGTEMLTPAAVHAENYGSTFWDAPQTNWNWPPRAVLDSEPYAVDASNGAVVLESKVDPCGLRFLKTFRANPARACFEIEYQMTNCADKALKVGPWEVTRVAGGLSFFPYEEVSGLPPTALQPVTYQDGVCWYEFDASFLNPGRKLFSGAREGWLAHVGPDRCLFIKSFPDTAPADYAPEQGEVEIWGHDGGIYIELENHGPYRELAPSESSRYRVDWFLVRLPESVSVKAGSPELVRFVRSLVGRA